ncbi:MAG: Holliday junction resolvase RuvX [Lachnospiraceae bacterium]|nr:Holliday junction resolvase RuvX [Lachnospiraceae bacterium]
MEGRILGLDYGTKTVGVAVSDPLFITAQPLTTIRRERPAKLRRTIAAIRELVEQYDVSLFVVGLPMGLDGIEGEKCHAAREFGTILTEKTGIPVKYQDERFTTVIAENAMKDAGYKDHVQIKERVDETAAALILQTYLDSSR